MAMKNRKHMEKLMIDHPGWNDKNNMLTKPIQKRRVPVSVCLSKLGNQGSQHRKKGTSAGHFSRSKLAPSSRRTRSPRRQFLYQEGMEFNQSILNLTRKKMDLTRNDAFFYIITKKI
jgi:hypothetical protein